MFLLVQNRLDTIQFINKLQTVSSLKETRFFKAEELFGLAPVLITLFPFEVDEFPLALESLDDLVKLDPL